MNRAVIIICVLILAGVLLAVAYRSGYTAGARDADAICYCGRR